MKYKFLGKSGLQISEIGFGTQTFGWVADKKEAFRIADYYAEQGGSYFDTADSYNGGVSESILGSWLKSRKNRESMIIGTKVFFPTGEGPNRAVPKTHLRIC